MRTGAAAVLAAETLGRADAATAAVVGAGVNGRAAARTFVARGRTVALWDVDAERARRAAEELGASVAGSLEEALAADLLVTVTPGHEVLLGDGSLAPGPAREPDGRRRARQGRDLGDRARADAHVLRRLGAGEPRRRARAAVAAGLVTESDVGRLGGVLAGAEEGRRDAAEITTFDSTGLAIQDLAIALAALERADDLELADARALLVDADPGDELEDRAGEVARSAARTRPIRSAELGEVLPRRLGLELSQGAKLM